MERGHQITLRTDEAQARGTGNGIVLACMESFPVADRDSEGRVLPGARSTVSKTIFGIEIFEHTNPIKNTKPNTWMTKMCAKEEN